MGQYFDNDNTIKSKDIDVKFSILDKKFVLKSDNGVFSKERLDRGSEIFIKTLIPLNLGEDVLDLGCGIGVIGLSLAHFNKANYTLIDVNERAVELAKTNIKRLNLSTRCHALVSNIFENVNDSFDSILLNPPIRAGKKVIYQMYQDSFDHLNSGGSLFIVIRVKQGALSSFRFLQTIYKDVKVIDHDKGYQIIRCIK
jgi:16S rRNA (guanine1207-N2)-methyltransferase